MHRRTVSQFFKHLCRLISADLVFMCTAQTKIIVHVKDPIWALFMLPFEGLTTGGMKTHRYCKTVAVQTKWWLLLLVMEEEDEGEDNQEKTHQSHKKTKERRTKKRLTKATVSEGANGWSASWTREWRILLLCDASRPPFSIKPLPLQIDRAATCKQKAPCCQHFPTLPASCCRQTQYR